MNNETNFKVSERTDEDIVFFDISGYLDAHTAPVLEKALAEAIKKGNYKIIVNFAGLDYISSAGLGVFMAFIEDVREANGDIKLTNMKEKVFSVFDLLGFPLLFNIEKVEKIAVGNFKTLDSISADE